jgi:hypothetical protein
MMSKSPTRITIVLHGSGSAMSIQQEGTVVATRTIGHGRWWMESALDGSMGPLLLRSCQLTYKVLRETTNLQAKL